MRGLRYMVIILAYASVALADPPETPPQPENSQDIWSSPEPGQTRQEPLPPATPPSYVPPPPPPEYLPHRHYYLRAFDPDTEDSLTELGLTAGTPSVLNLNAAYWGPQSFPIVIRASGMYYGPTYGAQLDVGYAFHREKHFRQYIAVSALAMQEATNFYYFYSGNPAGYYRNTFSGVGPSYGLNWYGFSLLLGVAFGNDTLVQSNAYWNNNSTTNQFQPQLLLQVGYTFIW